MSYSIHLPGVRYKTNVSEKVCSLLMLVVVRKEVKRMPLLEKTLKEIYYNPLHDGSLGGPLKLWRAVKERGFQNVSLKSVKQWLLKQDPYTLHAPARKRFQRNVVRVRGIDENWEADLVDVQNLKKYNDGYRYLLTCIDVLSKYVWVVPLKNKTSKDIVGAFKKILKDGRTPQMLHTDKGSEFMNREFQRYLKSQNISFFTTENETKACIVERFNRTLKTKMWRYFTFARSYRYLDVLSKLVKGYNHTVHSSIRMKPKDVSIENQRQVLDTLYGKRRKKAKRKRFKFQIGDQVRISKSKMRFEKGYEANWSEEIFTVCARLKRTLPVYRIKDYNDEELRGTFYEYELQKVTKTKGDMYPVEKILKTRTRKGKKQYLVRWKGYGKEFDSWIDKVKTV